MKFGQVLCYFAFGDKMKPISSNAVFHVSDLEKSLGFYTHILSFKVDFKFGDPPYAGLTCGDVHLHISSSFPYKNNTCHGSTYLVLGEVDSTYNHLITTDVPF